MLHLVGPGEGAMISALGSTYTTKTDGQATGGAYSPVEEELWGDPTPLHVHSREKEAFYVLFGRLAVWVDGTETVAAPGMFLVIPRGAPHAARRIGDEPPQVAPQHLANEDVLLSALTVTNGSSWRACYASCSWASNKSSQSPAGFTVAPAHLARRARAAVGLSVQVVADDAVLVVGAPW